MKNGKQWAFALIALFAIMSCFTACDSGGDGFKPPEEKTDAERWWVWVDDTSSAIVTHSVGGDGVCAITVAAEYRFFEYSV